MNKGNYFQQKKRHTSLNLYRKPVGLPFPYVNQKIATGLHVESQTEENTNQMTNTNDSGLHIVEYPKSSIDAPKTPKTSYFR